MLDNVSSETKQAIIAILVVFLVSCGIATIPKVTVIEAAPVDDVKAAFDKTKISDKMIDKVVDIEAVGSIEEAREQGIDVVEYDSMSEEEAASRGYVSYTFSDGTRVWYAKHAFGSLHAHDDGSLNEYDEGYFVAHSGTTYGIGIANLYPGAVVTVNGRDVVIEGCVYDNYLTGDVGRVRDSIGWDKVCFQTCVDNNGNVVIYYGHYVDGSTAAPQHEAREEEYAARWEAHQKYLEENAAQVAKLEAENAAKRAAAEEAAKKAAEERAQWEAQQAAKKAAEEQARAAAQAQAEAAAQQAASNQQSNSSSSDTPSNSSTNSSNSNAA